MASGKLWGASYRKLWGVIERSVRSFARHDIAVYATALAYRGLFALFPFAIFLVAVVGFLRVDAVLGWLAEQGPPGIQGEVPQPVASLLEEAFGRDRGWLLLAGIALAFWSVSIGALFLTKALNAVFEVQETRPLWKRIASFLTFAQPRARGRHRRDPHTRYLQGGVTRRMGGPRRGVRSAMDPAPLARGALPARARRGGHLPLRPQCEPHFLSVLPRAVVALLSWALASLAFSYLLDVFPVHGVAYGSLGTAISLLLYLYFSVAVLLFGAELNAELRRSASKAGEAREEAP